MSIKNSKEEYNEYMRKYHLKRYYLLKNDIIHMLGGKCILCGAISNLAFDHKNPNIKSFNITSMLTYSLTKLKKEINKCQLLCSSCHNIKTLKEQNKKIAIGTHGTLSSYRYCKCSKCRLAKHEYMKKWKQRRLTQDSVGLVL